MTDFLAAAQTATDFNVRYRLAVAATEQQPNDWNVWYLLGCLLHDARRWPAAAAAFSRANSLQPNNPRILHNLGTAYHFSDRTQEAERTLRDVAKLNENAAEPWTMLSQITGHPGWAVDYARRAVAYSNGAPVCHMALKNQLWMNGQWEEGFREYEWRFAYRLPEALSYPFPLWRGERVKRLLVQSEQGLGDTIWGMRWGPLIEDRAEHVVFLAHNEMVPLLESGAAEKWWNELLPMPQPLPAADAWIGLLSLPVACAPINFTEQRQYIDPEICVEREWLSNTKPLARLGIAWAGADDADDARLKNIPFTDMLRLAEVPNIELHSLQVGSHAKDMAEFGGFGLIKDRSPEIHSMLDTARIIAGLDLVIAVDTAVAHLAGAMGKPVWLLLNQRGGDGRWCRDGTTTPWYVSMQIWRRDFHEQWCDVLSRVCAGLV